MDTPDQHFLFPLVKGFFLLYDFSHSYDASGQLLVTSLLFSQRWRYSSRLWFPMHTGFVLFYVHTHCVPEFAFATAHWSVHRSHPQSGGGVVCHWDIHCSKGWLGLSSDDVWFFPFLPVGRLSDGALNEVNRKHVSLTMPLDILICYFPELLLNRS